jgi:phosphonoacetate hydrolase
MLRRYFFLGSLASIACARSAPAARRKILIILIDGFDPQYLEASDMPNLRRMGSSGMLKTASSVIPSVTNVNNASLITGSFPASHGVTANCFYDRAAKQPVEMENAAFLLKPTLLARARPLGWNTALVAAKDKVVTLCGAGAGITISGEFPSQEWTNKVGPAQPIYSAQVNFWVFQAANFLLSKTAVDLVYLSTTDYMMHTYAPDQAQSLEHLHHVDKLLGDIAADNPKLEILLTADHGMNHKTIGIDVGRELARSSIRCQAISVIQDKHVVHHKGLGGASYVYLEDIKDLAKARDMLREVEGVEAVYTASEAAARFHLRQEHLGDLVLLGAKEIAFGNLLSPREAINVRSHGSLHESHVPVMVYNRQVRADDYQYNLDLTRLINLERI